MGCLPFFRSWPSREHVSAVTVDTTVSFVFLQRLCDSLERDEMESYNCT